MLLNGILIIAVILLWITLNRLINIIRDYLYYLTQIYNILKKELWTLESRQQLIGFDVKKGNKDQQEIKTKLTNLRQSNDKHFVDTKKLLKLKKKA